MQLDESEKNVYLASSKRVVVIANIQYNTYTQYKWIQMKEVRC